MDEKTFEILHWALINSVQTDAMSMADYRKGMDYLLSQVKTV